MHPTPPELHFAEHVVKDHGSLALFWANIGSHIGIYQLNFADGSAYIGQSVSARTRLATHRRRWTDAVSVCFAPCAVERLNELELAMIRYAEKTTPLRNRLLTNRPGGNDDLIVTISRGRELALPWTRSRRGVVTPPWPVVAPAPAEKRKARTLFRTSNYPSVAGAAAALIAGAVPSPTETQAVLWSVSALPSTNRAQGFRRLLTLSAGRLEILRIFEVVTESNVAYPCVINLAPGTRRRDLIASLARTGLAPDALLTARYRALAGVQSLEVPDLDSLERLLRDPVILDSVYQLVVTLMRQGSAPLGRFHNRLLAKDLLDLARE